MELMLSKPKHGWAEINLDDFKGRVSYLNDIAFDWLKALKVAIENETIATLYGDEEGSDFYIVLDDYYGFVTVCRDSFETIEINYNKRFFAQELCNDIRVNLEGWATFCDYDIDNEEDREKKKEELLNLIAEVQEVLKNAE